MNTLNFGNVTLNIYDVKKASLSFRAINHKLRQQILGVIEESNNKITVTEIYIKLRLEQSVASQHLAILRSAGIVKTARDGKFIYYSVNYTMLSVINEVAVTLLKAI